MTRAIVLLALIVAACAPAPAAIATATPPRAPSPTLFSTTSPPTPSPSATGPAIRYVAIGASDTVGVGASDLLHGSWPARVAARLPAGTQYVNLGVNGSLTAQAFRDQLPTALGMAPQLVTVWLAVNDLNASISVADYTAALRSLIEGLVFRTAARVFVGNVPDLRTVPAYVRTDRVALLARITAYNEAIDAIAATVPDRVIVVDLFTGSGPLVSTVTVADDGFHPADPGYVLIADRFLRAIGDAGFVLR